MSSNYPLIAIRQLYLNPEYKYKEEKNKSHWFYSWIMKNLITFHSINIKMLSVGN